MHRWTLRWRHVAWSGWTKSMSRANQRIAWLCLIGAFVPACVLPDFHKVGSGIGPDKSAGAAALAGAAANASAGAPSLTSDGGVPGATASCTSCIQNSCAKEFGTCGSDCSDFALPINPAMHAPDGMTPLLTCLHDNCDDACDVTWGCVDHYRWTQPAAPFTIDLQVNDLIASVQHVADMKVSACVGSDPGCVAGSGLSAVGTTDANGDVLLTVPRTFQGYFFLDGNDDYMPIVGLWSQPAYWAEMTRSQPMVRFAVADFLGSGTMSTVDRKQSHLIFQALNCLPLRFNGNNALNEEADGVKITFTPPGENSSQVFYTITNNAIDITRDTTSVNGGAYGGAFNLPSTSITVTGHYGTTEVSRAVVQMRPGAVGFVYLLPNALR
jgi:hypothetical protein